MEWFPRISGDIRLMSSSGARRLIADPTYHTTADADLWSKSVDCADFKFGDPHISASNVKCAMNTAVVSRWHVHAANKGLASASLQEHSSITIQNNAENPQWLHLQSQHSFAHNRQCNYYLQQKCPTTANTQTGYLHLQTDRMGDRKGIRPVENWVLFSWWWWFEWSFAWLIAPVVQLSPPPASSFASINTG